MPRAPKKCGRLDCQVRVVGRTYCEEHTPAWVGSTRSSRLPSDWPERVDAVRTRAHGRCQARTHATGCSGLGSECDHIRTGDDHGLHNLQWLSAECHKAKTKEESRQRNRRRAAPRSTSGVRFS